MMKPINYKKDMGN